MDNRPSDLGALFRELKRRKVFRATALYAVAAWIVVEVAETTLPYLLFPEWTITLVIVLALVGFPITIALSWAFDVTPARATESGAAEREEVARPRWRLLPASLASLAVLIAGVGLFVLFLHPASGESFEGRDWILIPEFENQTGDETFDGTLAAALTTSVKQSRFVNVVDPRRVAEARGGGGAEPEEGPTRETTLELAARLGAKAVLFGLIRPEGQGFAISAEIVDPLSGKPMRRTLAVTAGRRETVLVALDVLAGRIRRALGETAEEIETGTVEIPVATTSSLEALKNWVEGNRAWREGHYEEAGRLYQLAVEEDSAFALAHAALGGYYYYWKHDRPTGDHHLSVALELRGRLTERERLLIEANAYSWRGDAEQAITTHRVYLRKYPDDDVQWYNLGSGLMRLGRCDEAIPALERSLELDPQRSSAYVNIASCHAIVGDYANALTAYSKAFELRPELRTDVELNREYGIVLIGAGDIEGARRHYELMLDLSPRHKARGHRTLGLLSSYLGRYREAVEHFREAVQYNQVSGSYLSEYRNRLFLASVYGMQAGTLALRGELDAVWDLQGGHYLDPFYLALSGQSFAWNGQLARASRNLELIRERANEGNRADAAAENLVYGELLLAEDDLPGALEVLSLASKLRDDAVYLEPLARAQRLAGDMEAAKSSYARVIETRALMWEGQQRWLDAHYWLARLHEASGDGAEAARWYRTLLDLWAEGDEDLPLRRDAERRLAQLGQP